ncbi:hypothetical protein CLAFUW4_08562 [Fulvia fulva]|uniref:Uncharacterized protein n=1 Tax=Passalora fulva TaxID=5499 RepID=A0A9Q8LC62_PASFU|nr:uncharacterized protein CLAFUR5_08664 [Fulvia fulva]KAK4628722.1 hypothetical protein CLAFUR4_08565 [Fulvia fulva]KAK4630605.1 hypothetical protein CLAFUR0_08560 [Fulvia fulva]UJO14712.1 hypothetical protein CLAFUR5_08664 [Fulvia fulva]WPV12404.1 hypothetical protein CLAFUW4_08562 [Fulvia fulva]WPV27411.1 hypothetical protein CLAFUW7_08560 [Fulvia fulva]
MADEDSRKHLPGIDTAPDVYETGNDVDDDTTTSTFQTSQSGADSAGSGSDTTEEDDDDYGVSRRRLFPQRARSRFGQRSRNVRTDGVDLSDRVDGKRKGYRVRRRQYDDDDGEDESLEARIARLRREVEECKAQAEEERKAGQEEEDDDDEDGENDTTKEVDALSRLLAGIDLPPTNSAAKRGHRRKSSVFHDAPTTSSQSQPEAPPDDQPLTQITTFDSRLAALESALGVSSILDSTTETSTLSTPLLPSLTLLDQQLSSLTTATSLSALEAATSKIQSLKAQADNLSSLSAEGVEEEGASTTLTPSDLEKLQSLYTILPTLQSLSPTVPALIMRLRSLNHIHTAAAQASDDLEAVEQRQAEMDRELKMWREGLEKVEKAVVDGLESNGRNGGMVKKWVEELEGRVKTLR